MFGFALMSSRLGYEITFPQTTAILSSLVIIVSRAVQPSLQAGVIIEKPQSDNHVNYAVKLSHITVVTSQLGEYCLLAIFPGPLLSI